MSQAQSLRPTPSSKPAFQFDTSAVDWRDFVTEGCFYRILNVDIASGQADMIVKFEANSECLYHRHTAIVTTLVLEGEQRLRERTDQGEAIKIKPAGTYSIGGEGDVHIEGAGDKTLILFFSMRTKGDVIYELLNDDLSLMKSITVADFHRDWQEKWPDDFKK
ncbi:MAG: hypothetical protein ABL951_08180 [Alphaproteobacteria bacterium]